MDASLRELNLNTSALARRAQSGEVITITDRGRPIAQLGPHPSRFQFARKADVLATFAKMAAIDLQRFRADLDEVLDNSFRDPYER